MFNSHIVALSMKRRANPTSENRGRDAKKPCPEDLLRDNNLLNIVLMFSSVDDQLRMATVSPSILAGYKRFCNSANCFDPRDIENELKPYGGLLIASWMWCEFVVNLLLKRRVGSIRNVDLSAMKEKVVSKLYDCMAFKHEEPDCDYKITELFSGVKRFVLPEFVDWEDMNALSSMSPGLEELVITSHSVVYLYDTNSDFEGFASLDDVVKHVQADPWEYTNLTAFEEEMQRHCLDPTVFTRFVVYLRAGFPALTNVRIIHTSDE